MVHTVKEIVSRFLVITRFHQTTTNMAGAEFPMHECVFRGDKKELSKLLRTHDVTQKDKHGMLNNPCT